MEKILELLTFFSDATNSSINVKKSLFKLCIKIAIIADEGDEKNDNFVLPIIIIVYWIYLELYYLY